MPTLIGAFALGAASATRAVAPIPARTAMPVTSAASMCHRFMCPPLDVSGPST